MFFCISCNFHRFSSSTFCGLKCNPLTPFTFFRPPLSLIFLSWFYQQRHSLLWLCNKFAINLWRRLSSMDIEEIRASSVEVLKTFLWRRENIFFSVINSYGRVFFRWIYHWKQPEAPDGKSIKCVLWNGLFKWSFFFRED